MAQCAGTDGEWDPMGLNGSPHGIKVVDLLQYQERNRPGI